METQLVISLICFILVGLTGLIFATMYLFRKQFMPYHADALGKSWSELNNNEKTLFIALMRVAGGGWLATTMATGLMLYFSLLEGESWAAWAILLTVSSVAVPTLIATLIVRTRTGARPPVFAVVLALLLLLAGSLLSIL